jgi:hypothetical protein
VVINSIVIRIATHLEVNERILIFLKIATSRAKSKINPAVWNTSWLTVKPNTGNSGKREIRKKTLSWILSLEGSVFVNCLTA